MEIWGAFLGSGPHRASKFFGACAAGLEMRADDRRASARLERGFANSADFAWSVGRVRVDRHDHWHAKGEDVFDLLCEVRRTGANRGYVLLLKHGVQWLAGHDPADAAVHLQRPDRRDHDRRIGPQPARPAFDVEELLGTHVCPEPGFGADDLVGRQSEAISQDRIVAVGNIGEGTGVDEGGAARQRL